MVSIGSEFVAEHLHYAALIGALREAFRAKQIVCPPKAIHNYRSGISDVDNTMLIMPAWDNQDYYGIKLISATPSNRNKDIPYLNGMYILFDAHTGIPAARMDAKLITHMRTAATSVLAASCLANKEASSVLIIGNGRIAPHYIRAYASQSNVNQIYLWGRNHLKSLQVVEDLDEMEISVEAVASFDSIISIVDIISCITSATTPIIQLSHVEKGQHLDLAGSFTTDMIEVATDVVAACEVYVDNRDVTPHHAGEIVQAIKEGKLDLSDIKGTLHDICQTPISNRFNQDTISLFKSTGMAIEDLVIAKMIFEKYKKSLA